MTMTVKLPVPLESGLRRYADAAGVPASVVIREAVAQYLAQAPALPQSAHALGADLFGRYSGPPELASRRKAAAADVWTEVQADKRKRGGG
ncbi:MAG: ribbon-helix-helix domain-containing protein [Pseudomonadota bacterium]|nr:ribbon-helix-helix domain-containing protein [Pseudomonadota bacterium]